MRVFSKQFIIKIVKYEDGMLILGQNVILCGHNVVIFSVWFLQLTVFKYLVASHVTEPGSSLTEPCAVIKFRHFCSHPGTCILQTHEWIIMYTCNIIMYTCIDHYVYMQDNYVYMYR